MVETRHEFKSMASMPELPSPLAPERYMNYAVQRKIIGFNATGDLAVFKQNDFDVTQVQIDKYFDAMALDKIRAEGVSQFLRLFPDGFSGDDALEKYSQMLQRLSKDEVMRQVMARFAGRENHEYIDPGDIPRFLQNYPTPVESSPLVEDFIEEIKDANEDPIIVYAYEEVTMDLLKSIYGPRFFYYQNIKHMHEKAQEGAKKKKPLRISKPSQVERRLGAIPVVALGTSIAATSIWGAANIASDVESDGEVNGPLVTTQSERQESELENEIEEEFGIEIMNIWEVYKARGKAINIYDHNEFGRHPPTRWSPEQLELFRQLMPQIPEQLYKREDVQPLKFTLTDYGEDCPCGGTFSEEGAFKPSVVTFSDSSFVEGESNYPRRVLIHELMHHYDFDVMERSLWPKVMQILGNDSFTQAREDYNPRAENAINTNADLDSVKQRLDYGFNGRPDNKPEDPRELVAVLGEIYFLHGKEGYEKAGELLGKKKAQRLYELIKDEVFLGEEYS